MNYKTKQRDQIEAFLKQNNAYSFSCAEIKNKLDTDVSKATIYRTVEKLVEEGEIKRFYNDLTSTYEYQFIDTNDDCLHHLHMKCTGCGKLIHLDCSSSSNFLNHLGAKHGFMIDQSLTMIYGLCSSCSLIKRR